MAIERLFSHIQGDDFSFYWRLWDVDNTDPLNVIRVERDMTGATGKCEVRDELAVTGNLIATMTFYDDELEDGIVGFTCSAAILEEVPVGEYFYDMQITHAPSGGKITYYQGPFNVIPQVTEGA